MVTDQHQEPGVRDWLAAAAVIVAFLFALIADLSNAEWRNYAVFAFTALALFVGRRSIVNAPRTIYRLVQGRRQPPEDAITVALAEVSRADEALTHAFREARAGRGPLPSMDDPGPIHDAAARLNAAMDRLADACAAERGLSIESGRTRAWWMLTPEQQHHITHPGEGL